MPRTGRPAVRRVAAVERAIAVLEALIGGELGTNEIARRTGLNASSASRQLATLASAGLVEHRPDSGRYRLGPRLVELGQAALADLDLRDLARPHLQALVEETGETATLSVPGEGDAITIDFVQSPRSVRSVAQVGRPSVGHATAAGKVVLAFAPARPRSRLQRFTERTIVRRAALESELEHVRRDGYARAVDERELGLSAVAAPVLDRDRELAAVLGVQGPSERLRGGVLDAVLPPLLEAASALSRSLGAPR